MGILDRFILLIYSLSILVISLVVLGVFAQLISPAYLWENFVALAGGSAAIASAAAGFAGFIFVLLSLYLLKVSVRFSAKEKKLQEAVVVHGSIGDVQITVEAIKNLVDKKARSVKGVREVKVKVEVKTNADKENVNIRTTLIVGQENNITEVSDQVRQAIKESLSNVVGLEMFNVDIVVDDISNAPVQKQRVV